MSAETTLPAGGPQPRSRTPRAGGVLLLLVPLMLVLFISNLDQTIVATALPSPPGS
jgi:UDP-N-acetylmuramyl pentapeptide phosphotransferase/UDP-N-acetylglucosamine-1-phosphate transferase